LKLQYFRFSFCFFFLGRSEFIWFYRDVFMHDSGTCWWWCKS